MGCTSSKQGIEDDPASVTGEVPNSIRTGAEDGNPPIDADHFLLDNPVYMLSRLRPEDPRYSMLLAEYSRLKFELFEQTQWPPDLQDAIDRGQQAVDTSAQSDPARPARLYNLGYFMKVKLDQGAVGEDLSDAIAATSQVVALSGSRDPTVPCTVKT